MSDIRVGESWYAYQQRLQDNKDEAERRGAFVHQRTSGIGGPTYGIDEANKQWERGQRTGDYSPSRRDNS